MKMKFGTKGDTSLQLTNPENVLPICVVLCDQFCDFNDKSGNLFLSLFMNNISMQSQSHRSQWYIHLEYPLSYITDYLLAPQQDVQDISKGVIIISTKSKLLILNTDLFT